MSSRPNLSSTTTTTRPRARRYYLHSHTARATGALGHGSHLFYISNYFIIYEILRESPRETFRPTAASAAARFIAARRGKGGESLSFQVHLRDVNVYATEGAEELFFLNLTGINFLQYFFIKNE